MNSIQRWQPVADAHCGRIIADDDGWLVSFAEHLAIVNALEIKLSRLTALAPEGVDLVEWVEGMKRASEWQPIETAPTDGKSGKFAVTNNLNAVDAFGRPSHRWLVSMVFEEKGIYKAFDGDRWTRLSDLTHWKPIEPSGISEKLEDCIKWQPGPANGGGGTAGMREDVSWWNDGDLLLIQVQTRIGPITSLVQVEADGDVLGFLNPETGDDDFGYFPDDIAWWAIVRQPSGNSEQLEGGEG